MGMVHIKKVGVQRILCSEDSAKMLFKKAGDPKEIWLVPGARHNKCAEVGGFEYKQRLADFFRQYL